MILVAGLTFTTFVLGCQDAQTPQSQAPPMRHTPATVIATYGPDRATSPVSGNYQVSPEGERSNYGGGMELGQGNLQVRYQFAGQVDYAIANTVPQQFKTADVYLFTVVGEGGKAINKPVVYLGEPLTIIDQEGLTVTLEPKAWSEVRD
jgi:hypothetical protein